MSLLVKTRGIVLNYIKFRESSIIVRIYTEELGLQSYIVNGVRSKGKSSRIALFQPYTLLNLVAYDTRKGGINRLAEYHCDYHYHTIPFDIRKGSIIMFLSEVLAKSVREEETNPALYRFLHDSVITFDQMEDGFENFHLYFLIQLAHFLGFGPESGQEITEQVTLAMQRHMGTMEVSAMPPRSYDQHFQALLSFGSEPLLASGRTRRDLLAVLMTYYQLHIDKLGEIKSLKVLSEVLSD